MRAGIYRIRNLQNGHCYIGGTTDLAMRRKRHFRKLLRNQHHCAPLQQAWNEFGPASFIWEIVEFCDASILLIREQHYMDSEKPAYNLLNAIKKGKNK